MNEVQASTVLEGSGAPVWEVYRTGSDAVVSIAQDSQMQERRFGFWTLDDNRPQVEWVEHGRRVPDWSHLLDRTLVCAWARTIQLWDVDERCLRGELKAPSEIGASVHYLPLDAHRLAYYSAGGIVVLDADQDAFVGQHDAAVGTVSVWSTDELVLATADRVLIWNWSTGQIVHDLDSRELSERMGTPRQFLRWGAQLIACTKGGGLWVWDTARDEVLLAEHERKKHKVKALLRMDDRLITCGQHKTFDKNTRTFTNQQLRPWHTDPWAPCDYFSQSHGPIDDGEVDSSAGTLCQFEPWDEAHFLVWSRSRRPAISKWKWPSCERDGVLNLPQAKKSKPHLVRWPDRPLVITYNRSGRAHPHGLPDELLFADVWDIDQMTHRARLVGHQDRINGVMPLDERRALSWSDDGTIRIWEI